MVRNVRNLRADGFLAFIDPIVNQVVSMDKASGHRGAFLLSIRGKALNQD